ncbi:MAG: hypothetical protein ACM3VT_17220, partial [Solirubrobacterales bacterium]
ALQTMRSLTYVLPGQTLSCVGCHEPRDQAPPSGGPLLAMRGTPSKLTRGPEGSWPLRFDRLVQPVLDRSCTECHRPGGADVKAARFDLTEPNAYRNLMTFGEKNLETLAFEKDRSEVNFGVARQSRLLALLRQDAAHKAVRLDEDSVERLVTWMDTYAQSQGHFSPEQERQLLAMKDRYRHLLAE